MVLAENNGRIEISSLEASDISEQWGEEWEFGVLFDQPNLLQG